MARKEFFPLFFAVGKKPRAEHPHPQQSQSRRREGKGRKRQKGGKGDPGKKMKSNLGGVERERKVRGKELKEGEDGKGRERRRRRKLLKIFGRCGKAKKMREEI